MAIIRSTGDRVQAVKENKFVVPCDFEVIEHINSKFDRFILAGRQRNGPIL